MPLFKVGSVIENLNSKNMIFSANISKALCLATMGISLMMPAQVAAPAVKKVMTKDGLVIVKGNKTFSLSGAQMK